MEKVMFKRMEVTGVTKEEALAQAPFNTNLPGADCTQALRNFKKSLAGKAFTDADMKQFMAEQLEKKTRNTPGNGCYIVIESAVADTRERPYTIEDIKNEQGARRYKTVYRWIDDDTEKIVAEVDTTKSDAKNVLKKMYVNKEYKGRAHLVMDKKCVEGQAVVAKAAYTPSKSSRVGTYLVFGIESC